MSLILCKQLRDTFSIDKLELMMTLFGSVGCAFDKIERVLVVLGVLVQRLFLFDAETRIHQMNIVDNHMIWRIHTYNVTLSHQEPLRRMPVHERLWLEAFPEIDAFARFNHHEPFLAMKASFSGKADSKRREFEELAKTIAVGSEDDIINQLLQV
jgi:hypothetical protein